VYSSIDSNGRYAYGNQPGIAHWNLARFAQSILPLMGPDEAVALADAQASINAFPALFQRNLLAGMRDKLGLAHAAGEDGELVQDLLERMTQQHADFTLTFRALCDAALGPDHDDAARSLFDEPAAFDQWASRWRERLARDGGDPQARRAAMRRANPAFIPRNHQVERVIDSAQKDGDFGPFEEMHRVLAAPFDDQPAMHRYSQPPAPGEAVAATFCGT